MGRSDENLEVKGQFFCGFKFFSIAKFVFKKILKSGGGVVGPRSSSSPSSRPLHINGLIMKILKTNAQEKS